MIWIDKEKATSLVSLVKQRELELTDFMWVTWSAFTVRMFPPSSLIGIIAASSHKACRSLPEYPVHVNNIPWAFWHKLRVVKIHFSEEFCRTSVLISVFDGRRLGVRLLFLAFFRAFLCKPYFISLTVGIPTCKCSLFFLQNSIRYMLGTNSHYYLVSLFQHSPSLNF